MQKDPSDARRAVSDPSSRGELQHLAVEGLFDRAVECAIFRDTDGKLQALREVGTRSEATEADRTRASIGIYDQLRRDGAHEEALGKLQEIPEVADPVIEFERQQAIAEALRSRTLALPESEKEEMQKHVLEKRRALASFALEQEEHLPITKYALALEGLLLAKVELRQGDSEYAENLQLLRELIPRIPEESMRQRTEFGLLHRQAQYELLVGNFHEAYSTASTAFDRASNDSYRVYMAVAALEASSQAEAEAGERPEERNPEFIAHIEQQFELNPQHAIDLRERLIALSQGTLSSFPKAWGEL